MNYIELDRRYGELSELIESGKARGFSRRQLRTWEFERAAISSVMASMEARMEADVEWAMRTDNGYALPA